MLKHLLVYRFLLVNAMAFVAVGLAYQRGLIDYLFENDLTYITFGITALFAFVWGTTAARITKTSRLLNGQKENGAFYMRSGKASKVWAKIAWITESSDTLVGLGLIGTVIGFSIALSGVEENTLNQAAGVSAALGPLMVGMKIALNTTIVGSVLGLWNTINQRMLRTATACYLADCEDASRVVWSMGIDTPDDFRSRERTMKDRLEGTWEHGGGGTGPT